MFALTEKNAFISMENRRSYLTLLKTWLVMSKKTQSVSWDSPSQNPRPCSHLSKLQYLLLVPWPRTKRFIYASHQANDDFCEKQLNVIIPSPSPSCHPFPLRRGNVWYISVGRDWDSSADFINYAFWPVEGGEGGTKEVILLQRVHKCNMGRGFIWCKLIVSANLCLYAAAGVYYIHFQCLTSMLQVLVLKHTHPHTAPMPQSSIHSHFWWWG